jgi:hypothetical protein
LAVAGHGLTRKLHQYTLKAEFCAAIAGLKVIAVQQQFATDYVCLFSLDLARFERMCSLRRCCGSVYVHQYVQINRSRHENSGNWCNFQVKLSTFSWRTCCNPVPRIARVGYNGH